MIVYFLDPTNVSAYWVVEGILWMWILVMIGFYGLLKALSVLAEKEDLDAYEEYVDAGKRAFGKPPSWGAEVIVAAETFSLIFLGFVGGWIYGILWWLIKYETYRAVDYYMRDN